jgi:nucleotide-binding universal stress UspA family protein
MLNVRRILFTTDYSEGAARAFPHAAHLAQWHDAELVVLSVAGRHLHNFGELRKRHPMPLDEMQAMLSDVSVNVDDLTIRQEQIEGASVQEQIVGFAEENDVDVIVMGTHGRTGVERLLIGSVAESVVRTAPCPVFTVRTDAEAGPPTTVRRILVPVDFSDEARVAVRHAKELALTYGARIDLLHVVEEVIYPSTYGIEPVELPTGEVIENVENALAKMAREDVGIEHAVVEARMGYAPNEILTYAREHDSDLIVIATHGRTGIDRLLMGSVAERVVRQSSGPVFVVKSQGKSLLSPTRTAAGAEST